MGGFVVDHDHVDGGVCVPYRNVARFSLAWWWWGGFVWCVPDWCMIPVLALAGGRIAFLAG